MNRQPSDLRITGLFFTIPTILLIIGYFLYPYPPTATMQQLIIIPLFLGLILLAIGLIIPQKTKSSQVKIAGWAFFSFFWSTQPAFLYLSEAGDVFNGAVCVIGVYILFYMAYQEWLSIQNQEYPSCLQWIAGGAAIAGLIYFTIDGGIFPALKEWLIVTVSTHSTLLLRLFNIPAEQFESLIIYNGTPIRIIFACTAIQSMVLFVGMIGALTVVPIKRRFLGISVTVIPIYFLNLIRNAGIIWMVGSGATDFSTAHNIIGKAGSLLALILLLFLTFKITPELFDQIEAVFGLTKRDGPIERTFQKLVKRSNQ